MPSRDPRGYVKAVPLPIPSQKGLKLQARSEINFNPTKPTRAEVRQWNYDRRLDQLTCQGFNAYNYKPYKGIGDPFFLDEKKLIMHALGQWDENLEWETSSSEEDDDEDVVAVAPQQASMTAAKFVLRRTRKDLNTLGKEVVKGRNMIRNVRLGHGLFDLIKTERTAKKSAAFAEKQKSLEQARNQWQPPKESSSEEETDDDLDKDEDLENAKSSDGRKKKKKQDLPRPYTPQHTNLTEATERADDMSKDALYRQLCALSWILDAMNIEQGSTMGPISTCWSHLDIGGSKVSSKKAKEEKKTETDWEKWVTNQQMGREEPVLRFRKSASKKGSVTRLNHRMSRTMSMRHNRMSVPPATGFTSISPSSSSSQKGMTSFIQTVKEVNNSIGNFSQNISQQEDPATSHSPQQQQTDADEDETLHRTGIFKFLDEYYDSLRREAQKKEEGENLANGVKEENKESNKTEDSEQNKKNREGRPKKSKEKKNQDKYARYDSPEDQRRSRFTLKDLRNSCNFKPKNSAELIEFHSTKPSNKHSCLRQTLHNKFKEVSDDKAMTLHDILEQMERERLSKCQNKFGGLKTRSMSFHRALEDMRREGERVPTRADSQRRQSSFKGNWYTDLQQSIPFHVQDLWYYRTVMAKLGKYGLMKVENSSKQSVYKFLKVLEGLRHWELCSPDVAAAVEFCRARIVDMSVDEFEEWFSQAFPTVTRPKTAPPTLSKRSSQDKVQLSTSETAALEAGKGGRSFARGKSARSTQGLGSREGARSAVSVANGQDGRLRLIQSAVAKRR